MKDFNNYLNSIGIYYTFDEMMEKADPVAKAGKRMTQQKQVAKGVETVYDAFVDGLERELYTSITNMVERTEKMNLDVTDYSVGIQIYGKLMVRLGIQPIARRNV